MEHLYPRAVTKQLNNYLAISKTYILGMIPAEIGNLTGETRKRDKGNLLKPLSSHSDYAHS